MANVGSSNNLAFAPDSPLLAGEAQRKAAEMRDLALFFDAEHSGDLGLEQGHDEVLSQLKAVRDELQPLLYLLTDAFGEDNLSLVQYMALGRRLTDFKEQLLLAYSHSQLSSVLSLAVLEHPSDPDLRTLLEPPVHLGRQEAAAVFTHVDFQDPRHQILGPNGFAARVVREFQLSANSPEMGESFARPSLQEGA